MTIWSTTAGHGLSCAADRCDRRAVRRDHRHPSARPHLPDPEAAAADRGRRSHPPECLVGLRARHHGGLRRPMPPPRPPSRR
ncbi:hypothetical protein ACRAWD_07075 [Caulobacter segnis]